MTEWDFPEIIGTVAASLTTIAAGIYGTSRVLKGNNETDRTKELTSNAWEKMLEESQEQRDQALKREAQARKDAQMVPKLAAQIEQMERLLILVVGILTDIDEKNPGVVNPQLMRHVVNELESHAPNCSVPSIDENVDSLRAPKQTIKEDN